MIRAASVGCTFYDTAEGYAAGENERLVGKALAPIRDQVVIATKFRVTAPMSGGELSRHIREHLNASLTRLGTDHVDLYYLHRVPDTTAERERPMMPASEMLSGTMHKLRCRIPKGFVGRHPGRLLSVR
jgi:aryl-alcohol dehydrogenase-like predicted oxidoreductase